MLNDTRALSKAAGHQRVVDRQTDSELHVKSPFPFKKKITLKHRRTRGSTHTRVSPPNEKDPTTPPHPHLSMVKYCLHLKTYTLLHPSFFKSSLFHFFFILFKRLVLKHNQACFCIIRASGCIWRQTNDSSAFRLKREPLLIYANRYIDR